MLIIACPLLHTQYQHRGSHFLARKCPSCLLQAFTMVRSSKVIDEACRVALAALSCRDLTSTRSCFSPAKPSLSVSVSWSSIPVFDKGDKHPAPRAQDYRACEHQHSSDQEEVSCKVTSGSDKKQWQIMQPYHKHHCNTLHHPLAGSTTWDDAGCRVRPAACMAHLLLLWHDGEAQATAVKENSSRALSMDT